MISRKKMLNYGKYTWNFQEINLAFYYKMTIEWIRLDKLFYDIIIYYNTFNFKFNKRNNNSYIKERVNFQ